MAKAKGSKASSSYRSAANTKRRVATSRKAAATKSAKQKAYRDVNSTRNRVLTSRSNSSGKSGPKIANKVHIGTTIGKAALTVAKKKK